MKPITRREMLTLGSAAAVALPIISTSAEELSTTKPRLKVIVTGGHPGDPEYGCGGTIAHYSDRGHEVVILYLNKGD